MDGPYAVAEEVRRVGVLVVRYKGPMVLHASRWLAWCSDGLGDGMA